MKKRAYKPKRETFFSLLARALFVVIVLSLVFAYLCGAYLRQTIAQQASAQITEQTSQMQQYIDAVQEETDMRHHMQEISAKMASYLYFDIMIEDPLCFDPNKAFVHLAPDIFSNCYAAAALVDTKNNIVASSKQTLMAYLRFSAEDDPDAGWYVCDKDALQIPEIDQLYADYNAMVRQESWFRFVDLNITSAYVNKETHSFIPHEGTMVRYLDVDLDGLITDGTERIEQEFQITVGKVGYELVEMHHSAHSEFPRDMFSGFWGAEQEMFERFDDFVYSETGQYFTTNDQEWENCTVYSRNVPVYVDGNPYYLEIRFAVASNDPLVRRLFWKWTLLFAASLTVIALLWAWSQNVLNKTKYVFEDAQRDLTDRLAHDIKTPLMAISGYAENIMKGSLSDSEQQQYLGAILDNVAFTDSLISRTLYLNHMEKNALKSESVQLGQLAEDIMKKYELLMDETHIAYRIRGSATLHADRTSLETIIENLVSNAVKYTPQAGLIEVILDQKHLIITNTAAKKISTKELTRPFVRGDEARSNVKGNGLGLAIAERAAQTCGYTLSLSCTDTEFKAELKF